ncbi:MAG: hypothetical protein ACKVPX_06170 [Myxococcaceae bacterium]
MMVRGRLAGLLPHVESLGAEARYGAATRVDETHLARQSEDFLRHPVAVLVDQIPHESRRAACARRGLATNGIVLSPNDARAVVGAALGRLRGAVNHSDEAIRELAAEHFGIAGGAGVASELVEILNGPADLAARRGAWRALRGLQQQELLDGWNDESRGVFAYMGVELAASALDSANLSVKKHAPDFVTGTADDVLRAISRVPSSDRSRLWNSVATLLQRLTETAKDRELATLRSRSLGALHSWRDALAQAEPEVGKARKQWSKVRAFLTNLSQAQHQELAAHLALNRAPRVRSA